MIWNISAKIPNKVRNELKEFSDLTAQLLYNRKILNAKQAHAYFTLEENSFSCPYLLPNIKIAAKRILKAIKNKEKIFIYGDYDVDGICATSICFNYLYRFLNADVKPFIPSRFGEGYGLSDKGLDSIIGQGGNLIITVDCGIRDREIIDKYSKKGLEFIVTDHHSISTENKKQVIPDKAVAVVHPSLTGSKCSFTEICAATITWKLVQVISIEYKKDTGTPSISPLEFVDLAAFATVCDVMPLQGENRTIVGVGLERLKKTKNIGLAEMMRKTDINPDEVKAYHFGYVIGPRFNASGRIDHALDGVRLLTSKSNETVTNLTEKLNELNIYRQKLTTDHLSEAESQIESCMEDKLFFVYEKTWQEGVVGLVAGKLCEKYNRPVIAATVKDGVVTGSARSTSKFNIVEAITASASILDRYGGHYQAAGFSLKEKKLAEFIDSLKEIASKKLKEEDLVPEISIDTQISLKDLNNMTLNELNRFEPYGFRNRTPTLLLQGVVINSIKKMGQNQQHIKLLVRNKGGNDIEMLGFNMTERFQKLNQFDTIDVVGTPFLNVWNGYKKIQFRIKDAKKNIKKTRR